ncbi:DUF5926 family protein [Trueperella bialowiezensis]|uniref:DUF5926 domain-containing protein n=1 Tax=Trueperella bialowiezensis TaxID=312285 RepID=A0A448PE55_9ACTO|nr:DUF5926 family protein [Trueperella bialowiezensis]VEI13190.1 Uncharacterised protein [Trueperella bialowiezensis]
MGKQSRRERRAEARKAKKKSRIQYVDRPFEGIEFEADLVAMREIIPSASMRVKLTEEHGGHELTFVTLLPGMAAALRRNDGELLVAMQTVMSSGDVSLDIAERTLRGVELAPGESFNQTDQPEPGPRLQDILDLSAPAELEIHDTYDYWVDSSEAEKPDVQAAIAQATEQMVPTAQVPGVKGAYWCRMQREFVRWVRPEAEDAVADALARLQHKRELTFDGSRFVGAFRAAGLLIPVFELEAGSEADELEKPMAEFAKKFQAAIDDDAPLSPDERRTRSGIISRQVTLR